METSKSDKKDVDNYQWREDIGSSLEMLKVQEDERCRALMEQRFSQKDTDKFFNLLGEAVKQLNRANTDFGDPIERALAIARARIVLNQIIFETEQGSIGDEYAALHRKRQKAEEEIMELQKKVAGKAADK